MRKNSTSKSPKERLESLGIGSMPTDKVRSLMDGASATLGELDPSDTYNNEYGRLLVRAAYDELAAREARLNPETWSPEAAATKLWEMEEERRRQGLRGLYSFDQAVKSKNSEPLKAAAGANSWKCNVAFTNIMNDMSGKARIDIGKTKTTPPTARSIHRGAYPAGMSRVPDGSHRAGDIITVDEGPGSADHIGVLGADPRGSGRLGVFHATGGVTMPDFVPDPNNGGGLVWTELGEFRNMFSNAKSFDPNERFRYHRYSEPEVRQDAKGGGTRAAEDGGDSEGTVEQAEPAQPIPAGGPRIVINPSTFRNRKDALCVAFNERFRIAMEQYGFEPKSEPTPAQRRFFADTAYADDEVQLRRTILARILTLDTSIS